MTGGVAERLTKFFAVPHNTPTVPNWLRFFLVIAILCNILAYFVVSFFTIEQINTEIEEHKASSNPAAPVWTPNEREQRPANYIEELEHRRPKVVVGAIVEIMLDTVDLINLFVDNHCLHLMYAVTKMISVGSWTLAQVDLGITPLWFIPIGIAMVITIIMQEWFEQYRRWSLALLGIIATFSWTIILTVRCVHIDSNVRETEHRMRSGANSAEYQEFVDALKSTKVQILLGGVFMVSVTLTMLVAIVLNIFWLCSLVAIMLLVGNVLWAAKLFTDSPLVLNTLFLLPLVYSVLIAITLLIYLFNNYSNKGSGGDGGDGGGVVNGNARPNKQPKKKTVTKTNQRKKK